MMDNTAAEQEHALTLRKFTHTNKPLMTQNARHKQYHSKIHTSQIGFNPVVTAAYPILLLLTRYQLVKKRPPLHNFYQTLAHELNVFTSHRLLANYSQDTISLAHYILLITIDEMTESYLTAADPELRNRFLSYAQQQKRSDNFFVLLKQLSQAPEYNIELLELMYLCLNTGFSKIKTEKIELSQLTEQLYQTIKNQRGDLVDNLFISLTSTPRKTRQSTLTRKIFLLGGVLVAVCYFSFNYALNEVAMALLQQSTHHLI